MFAHSVAHISLEYIGLIPHNDQAVLKGRNNQSAANACRQRRRRQSALCKQINATINFGSTDRTELVAETMERIQRCDK